ncbi:MAG TPA: YmdB family metallophosphoesterase [Acholeplasma sp.]|jgi:metallophosphoesterase (TIGR00282 family)|nr:YmdB family metallophosphoesterase [Acholeplasma sp.]
MKILIVGDIYSKLGRKAFTSGLAKIKEKETINFLIVNGENISHGKGMNENHYKWLLGQGVNVVTLGNHAFHNKDIFNYINEAKNIVRPANIETEYGVGFVTKNYNNLTITVIQVLGQIFMHGNNIKNPFLVVEEILENTKSDIYICDFHGEATSEVIAFGHYFTGKIDIIFGTHTHVQTNDACILNGKTAYITDVGMTGALESVIGVKKDIILKRFLGQNTLRFEPENDGKTQFSAILVDYDEQLKKVSKIETIRIIE